MTEDSAAGRDGGGKGLLSRRGGLKLPSLKHWRKRRGLTQKGLAHKLNLKQQYVGRVETGRLGCNPLVAQKLAEVLEVDLEELQAPPPLLRRRRGRGHARADRGVLIGLCTEST